MRTNNSCSFLDQNLVIVSNDIIIMESCDFGKMVYLLLGWVSSTETKLVGDDNNIITSST